MKRKSKVTHKSSSKQKTKGRISVPEELNQEQRQKKFEDLRRMPFSLNDDIVESNFHSPRFDKKRKKSKLLKQGKI